MPETLTTEPAFTADSDFAPHGNGAHARGAAESGDMMTAAWDEVLDLLQSELSGPTFKNYLCQIRPIALDEQSITLSVPNDFVKDWLLRRFAKRIEETLERVVFPQLRIFPEIVAERVQEFDKRLFVVYVNVAGIRHGFSSLRKNTSGRGCRQAISRP